jgi:hypothetical protein
MTASIKDFKNKVNQLLIKHNMVPENKNVGLSAWGEYLFAYAWTAHSWYGDGIEMLDILLDDNNLVDGNQFNKNFILRFEDLYPTALKTNKTWKMLMPSLVNFKGKGLGVGELYLAVVIQGWTFERTNGKGDGKVAGGIREIKKNGASLKPLAQSSLRIQDLLNASVFEGNRAGPVTQFSNHKKWIETKTNPLAIYKSYFSQLYPGKDIDDMCGALVNVTDGTEFNNIIGREVLKWYKDIDNWDSLVVIDQEKMLIANIADIKDLTLFNNIKFQWKSERGRDQQAVADGYVNIYI